MKDRATYTDEELAEFAELFESGEWPEGKTTILRGRPRAFGEELKPVTFKEPKGKIAAMDARASQLGMSRSDYLRHLVDCDLAAVGA